MSFLLTFTLSIHLSLKVKVIQSWPTFCDPIDYSVHGIPQARILEWVDFPFSRGSSWPRDRIRVSCFAGGFFTSWALREAPSVIILNLSTYLLFLSKCNQSSESTGFLPQWLPPHLVQAPPPHCLAWSVSLGGLNFFYSIACWTGIGLRWDLSVASSSAQENFYHPKFFDTREPRRGPVPLNVGLRLNNMIF